MNQILHCDWLPERASWSHLARSGLPELKLKIVVLVAVVEFKQ